MIMMADGVSNSHPSTPSCVLFHLYLHMSFLRHENSLIPSHHFVVQNCTHFFTSPHFILYFQFFSLSTKNTTHVSYAIHFLKAIFPHRKDIFPFAQALPHSSGIWITLFDNNVLYLHFACYLSHHCIMHSSKALCLCQLLLIHSLCSHNFLLSFTNLSSFL